MRNERYLYDRKLQMYLAPSIFLAVIFAFAVYKATKDSVVTSLINTCFITSVFLVTFLLCDVMLRLCQTLISLTYVNRQSGESFSSAVSRIFHLNTVSAGVVVIGVIIFLGLIIVVRKCPFDYVWMFGPRISIPLMMFSYCLLRMTNLAEWESSPSVMKGLDYGTGMAYSYYYGYLRLVLPSTGTRDSKGICEKIENFEDNHNITFPVRKLFILIPSSGYIPPDLKEASCQWMESASELEEEIRNRAGNIGRKYRNNVYKIYPDGLKAGVTPQYVVAEGASPLLTYHEVLQHNHPESALFKRYKTEIIQIFHEKLLNILQSNPDTRDLCELIYYNDYDSNGTKVNVGEIILERISKIQSST